MLSRIQHFNTSILVLLILCTRSFGHNVAVDTIHAVVHDDRIEFRPVISDHAIEHTSIDRNDCDASAQYVESLAQSLVFIDEKANRLHLATDDRTAHVCLDDATAFLAVLLRPAAPLAQQARQVRILFSSEYTNSAAPRTITLTSAGNVEFLDLHQVRGIVESNDLLRENRFMQPLVILEPTPEAFVVEWHIPARFVSHWLPTRQDAPLIVDPRDLEQRRTSLTDLMSGHLNLLVDHETQLLREVKFGVLRPLEKRFSEAELSEPLCILHVRLAARVEYSPIQPGDSIQVVYDAFDDVMPSADVLIVRDSKVFKSGMVTAMDRSIHLEGAVWTIGRRALQNAN